MKATETKHQNFASQHIASTLKYLVNTLLNTYAHYKGTFLLQPSTSSNLHVSLHVKARSLKQLIVPVQISNPPYASNLHFREFSFLFSIRCTTSKKGNKTYSPNFLFLQNPNFSLTFFKLDIPERIKQCEN